MPANLKQLTSLRIFAALWVVAYTYWPSLSGGRPIIVDKGYLGVDLFFVLSGFVLTHVYLDLFGAGRLRYGAFLWTRLARIYPLHLLTIVGIAAMAAVAGAAGHRIDHPVTVWSALPANLALVHAWNTVRVAGWNHPSWSISAEWFAYVSFPAFAWAAWRVRERPRLATGGALAVVAVLYPLFQRLAGFPLSEATTDWGALRIIPCFALGCAANLLWRHQPVRSPAVAYGLTAAALLAIVAGLLAGAPDPLLIAAFGLLILGLASLASAGSRLLTAAPLVYLGEASFAVYMLCIPWQLAFSDGLGKLLRLPDGAPLPLPLWLLQAAGLIALSCAIHQGLERPVRTWMRANDPFRAPWRERVPATV